MRETCDSKAAGRSMSEAILPSGNLRAQRARELGVQAIQQAVSAEPPCRRTAHGLDSSTRGSPVWVEVQHAHAWEERAAADVERATELGTGERVATLRC